MKALLLCAALAACAAPAFAQNCAPRDVVVGHLVDNYGEQQRTRGIAGDGSMLLEMWANTETGSWSTLIVGPDGVTCLVASGMHFQIAGNAPEGDPA